MAAHAFAEKSWLNSKDIAYGVLKKDADNSRGEQCVEPIFREP
jgi:hypothetical protein